MFVIVVFRDRVHEVSRKVMRAAPISTVSPEKQAWPKMTVHLLSSRALELITNDNKSDLGKSSNLWPILP